MPTTWWNETLSLQWIFIKITFSFVCVFKSLWFLLFGSKNDEWFKLSNCSQSFVIAISPSNGKFHTFPSHLFSSLFYRVLIIRHHHNCFHTSLLFAGDWITQERKMNESSFFSLTLCSLIIFYLLINFPLSYHRSSKGGNNHGSRIHI